jgi:hypothetical protein
MSRPDAARIAGIRLDPYLDFYEAMDATAFKAAVGCETSVVSKAHPVSQAGWSARAVNL